jgi:multicomponent Na+:H+ antiporter subunit A
MPQLLAQPLLNDAANNIQIIPEPLELALWHGFNLIFILSLFTLIAGFIIYRYRTIIQRLPPEHDFLQKFGPAQFYEKGLIGLEKMAVFSTRFFQHGRLPDYAATLVGVFCALMLTTLFRKVIPFGAETSFTLINDFYFYELVTLVLIPIVLYFVLRSRSRLTSLAVMGVVGYAVALIFILFGAPDVAITQFLIETLTVVLFVLVLHRLPVFLPVTPLFKNLVHAVVALLFGGLIIFLLLLVTSYPLDPDLKNYFAENSYTLGKGKNVVNVILVDFRALDTMGEITVLGIVAIGIFALLRLKLPQEGEQKP